MTNDSSTPASQPTPRADLSWPSPELSDDLATLLNGDRDPHNHATTPDEEGHNHD